MTDDSNPLLQPSALPYGLPDFAAIRAEHYLPAFEVAFARHLSEISRITMVRSMPTFENTIEALERSGELLDRVAHAFYTVTSADATPEIQDIDEKLAPLMAAHQDAITLDSALYCRVQQVHAQLDRLELDEEQRYLVERHHREMTLAGAALDDEHKARLTALNQQLSTLTNTFERNLLNDTNDLAVVFDSADELAGLSSGELSAARRAAADRDIDGYLIALPLFTGHPYLAQLRDRTARRRILDASRARGSRDNAHDNRPVLREIVRLRAERAALLGFSSHAAYVTADETAGTPDAVEDMLRALAAPSARNARAEQAELQSIVDETEADPFTVEAHDWAFYTEKVRTARYDIDTSALRPWFEAERVLQDGVFFAATRLYGVTISERHDLVAYHPGARVFEVRNADRSELGLYVLDLYTRDSKRGGAWMNPIVSQSRLRGTSPVVVNNLNVPLPGDGEPTLLTLDEVTTLFHEFGHALHGLFAEVTYPHFAGTNVFRDFVEFPSQVNEMWILWPEVLDNYARHHVSGEPLDPAVVERLRATETFDQGHATSEYLAAAWLDQAWHRIGVDVEIADVAEFEAAALADIGLDNPVVPTRYSSTYFAHVFSGGYSAGYYSYIWSEVLDADTVEWFRDNGGLTRENGDRFRARLLGVGGSKDPLEAYHDFRGRSADIAPLLKRRGLEA
ncbi:M3 family metallopeptidase [Microbacterium foliorum]|uniref:M3 family metallopeptidase n=1 Tax=Microbacterium foliorum TaxID=104336 RepID=UPI001D44C461|nr:M3 family metallopeptidase [Microbacterium foliorum]CAH0178348.1 Dipeptidyl carboxypeptidase [Microbacterium foliorum]CAH0243068.1 Dipeptidyl carboxypeptidase [Microbacterium foliorum]